MRTFVVDTEIRFKDKEGNWGNWLTPGPTYVVDAENEKEAKNKVDENTGDNLRATPWGFCEEVEKLEV